MYMYTYIYTKYTHKHTHSTRYYYYGRSTLIGFFPYIYKYIIYDLEQFHGLSAVR